ncbi:hypothetical protein ACLIKD_08900 [Azonexus sp. IMCC34842]|uniref:hypothetical protein n=1 Tax=Azonexus sp. IMCC34842 TaxID=3420950 RepID=UPI003D129ECF
MNQIPEAPIDRDGAGLFQPGNTVGNAGGRPRGTGPARRLEQLISADGAALFELAFERARHNDDVLAALVHLIAAAETSSSIAAFRLASAQTQGGTN